jgi:hypothetical protein
MRNPSSFSGTGTPACALEFPRHRQSPDQHLGLRDTYIPVHPKPRPACAGRLQSTATNSPPFTLVFRTNVNAPGVGARGQTLPTATDPALAAEEMAFSSSPLVPDAPQAGVACGPWVTPRRRPALLDPLSAKLSDLEGGSFLHSFTFARFYSLASSSSPKLKTYNLKLVTLCEAQP